VLAAVVKGDTVCGAASDAPRHRPKVLARRVEGEEEAGPVCEAPRPNTASHAIAATVSFAAAKLLHILKVGCQLCCGALACVAVSSKHLSQ
jgi:hypothetical protein